MLFASEIKALLVYPSIQPKVSLEELWQLLFLSPAKLQGCGIFNGIDVYKRQVLHLGSNAPGPCGKGLLYPGVYRQRVLGEKFPCPAKASKVQGVI